jgi:mRNA interferase RelE/StbE
MKYTILILPRAKRELAQLPQRAYEQIRDAVRALSLDPRPQGSTKMSGRDAWRLRLGDYRVIYGIDDRLHAVTILHVGHRRDVYRR